MSTTASRYVDFEVVSEPWNRYNLGDGTTLKLRYVLLKITTGGESKGGQLAALAQNLMVVTQVPEALLGSPGREYPLDQIAAAIVEDSVPVTPISEEPSVYRLADGTLVVVTTRVRKVGRSSLYGPDREPKYRVETEIVVEFLARGPQLPPAGVGSTDPGGPSGNL